MPKKILVIDDDEFIRIMVEDCYENRDDFSVTTIKSASQAMSIIAKEAFDIILLDGFMPGITGFKFISYCKKISKVSKIIMISGNEDLKIAIQAIRDGACDYVLKPFTINELKEAVDRAIK